MKNRIFVFLGTLAFGFTFTGCGGGGTIDEGMPKVVDQAQIDAEFRDMMSGQGSQMEKNASKVAQ